MGRRKKKRPIEEKHALELTTDEALERLFGKEVRDELKKVAEKDDRYGETPPHK
ncbi:MAG: hypothetical protein H0U23_04305 [Blastocatellia bacterium]|nr:hypothetical protein [Blastocatellia bacterium]